MPRYGLKLGLGERGLTERAARLWRDGAYDFLELYVPANAEAADAGLWDWYDGMLVLHAPHAVGGFNFSRPEMEDDNFRILETLEEIRAQMKPTMLVFHPGIDGTLTETLRQIARLRREYPSMHQCMLMENKPRLGLHGELCLGFSPEEMSCVVAAAACGFCLDIRHAFAYAAWAELKWREVIADFSSLAPRLWHAADGLVADLTDSHRHIGDGDLPWEAVADYWDGDAWVTIECAKDPGANLDDFLRDIAELRRRTGKER